MEMALDFQNKKILYKFINKTNFIFSALCISKLKRVVLSGTRNSLEIELSENAKELS